MKLGNGISNAKIARQGVELTRLNNRINLQGADINCKLKAANDDISKLKLQNGKLKAANEMLKAKINQQNNQSAEQ